MTPDRTVTSPTGDASLALDTSGIPGPDRLAEPEGFTVTVDSADRIHFLDWGGPAVQEPAQAPGILAIHGLSQTAWAWTPPARRLVGMRRFVAMDLRGHGLSDAPTHGYDLATLADDVEAVLIRRREGSAEGFIVPIDASYELVGRIRRSWRGFSGGDDVWREIDEFFARLADRARAMVTAVSVSRTA